MSYIFLKLLNMSITAGWLILAVLCIRLIFTKIPRWVNCLLWGVVAIRLICPFSIENSFSILHTTEPIKSHAIVEGALQNNIPSIDSQLTIVKNTINPMLIETFAYNESESAAPLQVVIYIAGMIWVCGMALLIICAMGSSIMLHRLVREAVCMKDTIYICDAVKSPFILGIVRPRIYLSSALNEKEMDYILAHESAHLRRKDHWWKPLGYLLLCIYWFQPLCWVAYAALCKDIELACDEKVAKAMTFHEKKEYAKVLLSCTRQSSLIMVCPLAFGEVGVKERVKSVLHYKKPAVWLVFISVFACLIVAVCFLTTAPKTYQIKVTIPANGTERFYYSNEEISPKSNTLTMYAGRDMGDGEIKLLPVEAKEENAYDEPAYITPGMPVKMNVEKGAWFKIGVNNIQNMSGEDIVVYLSVENVDVRVASATEATKDELPVELLFASGASSSGTTLTLNWDGSFVGQHFDHENIAGSNYPNGICNICNFSGQFENIKQINEYTYSMTLRELVTEEEEGEEWIENGALYIASKPYGLEGGKEFLFYMPGTPLEELSEDFLSWWLGWWSYQHDEENPQTLPCYGLLNIETGEGFFS